MQSMFVMAEAAAKFKSLWIIVAAPVLPLLALSIALIFRSSWKSKLQSTYSEVTGKERDDDFIEAVRRHFVAGPKRDAIGLQDLKEIVERKLKQSEKGPLQVRIFIGYMVFAIGTVIVIGIISWKYIDLPFLIFLVECLGVAALWIMLLRQIRDLARRQYPDIKSISDRLSKIAV